MARPRTKPVKIIERDRTGVVIPVSAFGSLMVNDAAWRALLRLPVGYSVKRSADSWTVFDPSGVVMFEWPTPDVAIQEVVGYGD
jgi:hypothetical protein